MPRPRGTRTRCVHLGQRNMRCSACLRAAGRVLPAAVRVAAAVPAAALSGKEAGDLVPQHQIARVLVVARLHVAGEHPQIYQDQQDPDHGAEDPGPAAQEQVHDHADKSQCQHEAGEVVRAVAPDHKLAEALSQSIEKVSHSHGFLSDAPFEALHRSYQKWGEVARPRASNSWKFHRKEGGGRDQTMAYGN